MTLPGGNFRAGGIRPARAPHAKSLGVSRARRARRLFQAYGTRVEMILGDAKSYDQLGPRLCGGLTGAEVQLLDAA